MTRVLFLIALAAAFSGVARADIYSYRDAQGVLHFSNVPDDPRYRLAVAGQRDGAAGAMPLSSPVRINVTEKKRFAPLVEETARTYEVEPALIHAVIAAESGYNPAAVSKKGAQGLMQLMPDTAKRYGVENSFDPAQNIKGGAQYLKDLLQTFDNDLELAVAAYNAGEKAVQKYGNQIPPYRETLGYVPRVLKYYRKYRSAG